jgi:hypothetical protein
MMPLKERLENASLRVAVIIQGIISRKWNAEGYWFRWLSRNTPVVYRGLELSELELSIGWMLGREFLSLVQMTEQDAGAPSQQKGTTPSSVPRSSIGSCCERY